MYNLATTNHLARLIERTRAPSPALLIHFARAREEIARNHGDNYAAEHITMPSQEPFSKETPWGYTFGQA